MTRHGAQNCTIEKCPRTHRYTAHGKVLGRTCIADGETNAKAWVNFQYLAGERLAKTAATQLPKAA